MRFEDIENIWTVDLILLSNGDRSRVYYERAKQVIGEAMANPTEVLGAVKGTRFRRAYLVEKIGCAASVTTQNPRIKALLANADRRLASQASASSSKNGMKPSKRLTEFMELRSLAVALQRRVDEQAALIAKLQGELRRS